MGKRIAYPMSSCLQSSRKPLHRRWAISLPHPFLRCNKEDEDDKGPPPHPKFCPAPIFNCFCQNNLSVGTQKLVWDKTLGWAWPVSEPLLNEKSECTAIYTKQNFNFISTLQLFSKEATYNSKEEGKVFFVDLGETRCQTRSMFAVGWNISCNLRFYWDCTSSKRRFKGTCSIMQHYTAPGRNQLYLWVTVNEEGRGWRHSG